MDEAGTDRIRFLELPESAGKNIRFLLGDERAATLSSLIRSGRFQPLNDNNGPYDLSLSVEEDRLVMRLRNANAENLPALVLSLNPYRRLIKDYFLVIRSYETARPTASREKLETIDMARRGLHNEGAELIAARLKDKIDMDFETARQMFTLICAMHKNDIFL